MIVVRLTVASRDGVGENRLLTCYFASTTAAAKVSGGGVFSNSSSTAVNIDDTFPVGFLHANEWDVYMANASRDIDAEAVCAGT